MSEKSDSISNVQSIIKTKQIYPEEMINKTMIIPKLKKCNTDKSIKTIVSNLFYETKYMTIVDKYDKFITFSTIIILIFTLFFFIWGLSIGAVEQYTTGKDNNNESNLNYWYKIWKMFKFIINIIAGICVSVQLYRRGIHPILEKCEMVTEINDTIERVNNRRYAKKIIVPFN